MRQFPRRQDLFSRNRWWEAGRISGDEGISRQLIGIANRCGVFADQFCSSGYFTAKKDFYGNAVIRPLRTATRRSWQPGGFGDSCLPDGIFHGALDYRFEEAMPTPDAVSRSM